MKTFQSTQDKKYTFSTCEICDAKCCDGRRGTIFSQLLLEDFQEIYKNFPIAFLLGDLGFLKPVVLLTNGKSYCRYLKDFKCTIYEQRPSVCKVYPLSPNLTDTVFIDTLCPAVNQEGEVIVENSVVPEKFNNYVLEDYQDKYIKMHYHFDKFNEKDNLEVLTQIGKETFYKFKKSFDDKYIQMHLDSLKNFDEYYTKS